MADRYTKDELVQRLDKPGWRAVGDEQAGTLRAMAQASHAKRAQGQVPGRLEEIETRIEVGLIELEELWHHLGLPV
jgi:transcription elongation GreA/GreB family factor